jgi:DNA-binding MarR family transcriptional regulator
MSRIPTERKPWLFLTSHAHVLLQIGRDPDSSAGTIAAAVGITLRQTQRIVADLAEAGYIDKGRRGRTNHYRIHPEARLRHPLLENYEIGAVLDALDAAAPQPSAPPKAPPRGNPWRPRPS